MVALANNLADAHLLRRLGWRRMALILAGVGIIATESILSYNYLTQDLANLTQMIGENSTGALADGTQLGVG